MLKTGLCLELRWGINVCDYIGESVKYHKSQNLIGLFWNVLKNKQTESSHNAWFRFQHGPQSSYWTNQPNDCLFLSLSQTRVFLQQLVAGPEASGFSFWEQSSETCFSKELINLFLLSFRKKWKFQNNPTPLRHIYQPKDKGSNMQLMMVLLGANNSGKMLPEVVWSYLEKKVPAFQSIGKDWTLNHSSIEWSCILGVFIVPSLPRKATVPFSCLHLVCIHPVSKLFNHAVL